MDQIKYNIGITVEIPEAKLQGCTLKLYNLPGEMVYLEELKNISTSIDVSAFGKGIYSISLENKTSR